MMPLYLSEAVTMVTKRMPGYLGDEVYERLSSQLLDPLCVETGQVIGLSLPLGLAAAVKCPVLCEIKANGLRLTLEVTTEEFRWSREEEASEEETPEINDSV